MAKSAQPHGAVDAKRAHRIVVEREGHGVCVLRLINLRTPNDTNTHTHTHVHTNTHMSAAAEKRLHITQTSGKTQRPSMQAARYPIL
jgi:hypothetical protein